MSGAKYPWDRKSMTNAPVELRVSRTLAWAVNFMVDLAGIEHLQTNDPHLADEAKALAVNVCKVTAALLELNIDEAERLFDESRALVESWEWKATHGAPGVKQ